MNDNQRQAVKFAATKAAGVTDVNSIDPAKLQKWISLIIQFLPMIFALFTTPTPAPTPAPVQESASITTIDGLMDYVVKTIELHGLTEDQQTKVLAAVEALTAFLTM